MVVEQEVMIQRRKETMMIIIMDIKEAKEWEDVKLNDERNKPNIGILLL